MTSEGLESRRKQESRRILFSSDSWILSYSYFYFFRKARTSYRGFHFRSTCSRGNRDFSGCIQEVEEERARVLIENDMVLAFYKRKNHLKSHASRLFSRSERGDFGTVVIPSIFSIELYYVLNKITNVSSILMS